MDYRNDNNAVLVDPENGGSPKLPLETGNTTSSSLIPLDVNADKREQSEKNLWRWNFICFNAHLVQAIACLVIGLTGGNIGSFKLPLTTLFLSYPNGYPIQSLQQRALLPFVAVTSIFSFLSAAAHLLALAYFDTYLSDLRRGLNKFRWYEYALSSSLMIGLIAMLFGMYDIISLVLIMSVNACMNFFGYMMEVLNEGRSKEQVDWYVIIIIIQNHFFIVCSLHNLLYHVLFI